MQMDLDGVDLSGVDTNGTLNNIYTKTIAVIRLCT